MIEFITTAIERVAWSACNIGHEFNTVSMLLSDIDAYWYHFVVLGLN